MWTWRILSDFWPCIHWDAVRTLPTLSKRYYSIKLRSLVVVLFGFLIFCLTKGQFLVPLIAPVLDFVCPSSQVSNLEWISRLHSFLLAYGDPIGYVWCDTLFSTNRGVHCIKVYTAWQLNHFDPHTCSCQTYPQAMVASRSEPGLEPIIWLIIEHHLFSFLLILWLLTWKIICIHIKWFKYQF